MVVMNMMILTGDMASWYDTILTQSLVVYGYQMVPDDVCGENDGVG